MKQKPGSSSSGYSPPIRITLDVGSHQFAVAQLGEDFLVLRSPLQLAPTSAMVTVNVDGECIIHHISLPNGIDPALEDQALIHLGTVPLAKVG